MSTATIIDGKEFAAGLRGRIAEETARLKKDHNLVPGLAVVLVGEDPASQVYVRSKGKQTVEVGMNSFEYKMSAETTQEELLGKVHELNNDPAVHGILVQLPVPAHIDDHAIINAIDPNKDVDGFHVINSGRLATGAKGASAPMVPCTPLGSLMLLKDHLGDLSGKTAVVVGRSNIVGKPMAQLLLQESCTVTIAHSRTKDLPAVVRQADIVVAAVGRPEMVKGDWIKPGATVIDVGINRIELDGKNKLVGDVATAEAMSVAGAITPVPGGVGPMTIGCLLANTLTAACRQAGIAEPKLL
ncbi:bifunctional methylenetetrahydrofolate dehydrogenase/methenyltetrahydrofolate cyclohydrolase FolD [Kiloniella laminariae]|uniref:bifunctional methylenetetrahydrofolate dehydrogenase/methenyltetrahydrofolate cyclohydrolase FolD n=1 Tax=Kiloniella laminariae TaxID=454162 RepID=UPI000377B4EC|nr:bifunctional methylenetetrahydrofolate dehydrogenase/methenyltetrahydrofolate cyclohydrolase FolD [Kiloniella laminariae]